MKGSALAIIRDQDGNQVHSTRADVPDVDAAIAHVQQLEASEPAAAEPAAPATSAADATKPAPQS